MSYYDKFGGIYQNLRNAHKMWGVTTKFVVAIICCLAASFTTNAQTTIPVYDAAGLADAITSAASGDIISIEDDITLTTALPSITKDLTINGNGHTIDGDEQYQIFNKTGGSVAINNLNFTGGAADNGGAVYNAAGNLTFIDCEFHNNTATGDGGAIYTTGVANFSFQGCIFRNNTADNGGGVFIGGGFIEAIHCMFFTNTGGGIYMDISGSGNVSIFHSSIVGNTGGGIYMANGDLYSYNCLYVGNGDPVVENGGSIEFPISGNLDNNNLVGDPMSVFGKANPTPTDVPLVMAKNADMVDAGDITSSTTINTPSAIVTLLGTDINGTGVRIAGCPVTFGAVENPTVTKYTLTLIANTGGSVEGGGLCDCGTTKIIKAIPDDCYNFTNWTDDVDPMPNIVSISTTYSVVGIFGDSTFTATFATSGTEYDVTVTNDGGDGTGTVDGNDTYDCGDIVTITASAATGSIFKGWYEDGKLLTTANTYTFKALEDRDFVARFDLTHSDVSIQKVHIKQGTLEIAPKK